MKQQDFSRMKQSQAAKAKNLAEWRKSRLHETTLPSGLDVVLRDVDLPTLMLEGNIPNTLIEVIGSDEFQKLSEQEAGTKLLGEHKDSFNSLVRDLTKASMVEPALGDVADDTHILYGELSFEDKMFIFNFANREAEAVRSFREGTREPGEPA